MKNVELRGLITEIQGCLASGVKVDGAEVLAIDYARECRAVNQRLVQVAEMLNADGALQALQFSEMEPCLIERAGELSFGNEMDWQEFCQEHGHEVAPVIDADTVDRLDELYRQGLSPGHPLYKEYRSAALSRDDEKAYSLARLIVRMMPDDSNARGELERLERKKVHDLLGRIEAAMEADHDADMLALLEELERAGDPEELEKQAVYGQATERRWRLQREEALEEMPAWLAQAESILAAGNADWREASVIHKELTDALAAFGITLEEKEREREVAIAGKIQKGRAEAERQARLAQLASELAALGDEAQAKSVIPTGIDVRSAGAWLEKLQGIERELSQLRAEFAPPDQARQETLRDQLEQVIGRWRSRRRARLVTASVGAVLLLGAVLAYGIFSKQAEDRRALLVQLMEEGKAEAVAGQIEEIRAGKGLLLRFAKLAAEVDTAERWVADARVVEERVGGELDELEALGAGGFAGIEPVALHRRLEDVKELLPDLPADLSEVARAQMAILRNKAERYMEQRQDEANRAALEVVTGLSEQVAGIDFEGPAFAAWEVAEEGLAQLGDFAAMADLPVPLLRLPASTESQVAEQVRRSRSLSESAGKALAAQKTLGSTKFLTTYQAALEEVAEAGFRVGGFAQRVADHLPNEDRHRAFLLFNGDLTALATARNMTEGEFPRPDGAVKKERDLVERLASPYLVDVHELTLTWGIPPISVKGFSSGRLVEGNGNPVKFSGRIAEGPFNIGRGPQFKTRNFGTTARITKEKLTPTSALVETLRLNELLNPTGTEFERSPVPGIDRILNDENADPLAKAYLIHNLFDLMRGRPAEWGLHFIPEIRKDMEEARALSFKLLPHAHYWMLSTKPKGTGEWEQYFKERTGSNYYQSLRKMHQLAQMVLRQRVVMLGYIDSDGVARMQEDLEEKVAWCLAPGGDGKVGPRLLGTLDPGQTISLPDDSFLPLSPIFGMEIGRADLRDYLVSQHSSRDEKEEP
ncbi:MAG: hypothetical protein MK194_16155 [Roseibacillus sp.]|nr:hypothetical protein [Roseibacillus sp.]